MPVCVPRNIVIPRKIGQLLELFYIFYIDGPDVAGIMGNKVSFPLFLHLPASVALPGRTLVHIS